MPVKKNKKNIFKLFLILVSISRAMVYVISCSLKWEDQSNSQRTTKQITYAFTLPMPDFFVGTEKIYLLLKTEQRFPQSKFRVYTPTLKNDGIFHLSKQVADIWWMATVACSSHNFIKVDYNCRFPSLRIGDSKWKKHCSIMNQSLFLNKLKTYIMADKCSQERIISLATVISIYPKV